MSVEIPEYGGCLWPVDPACLTEQWGTFSEAVQNRALALASSTLERLTGHRVGNCPITVRPIQQSASCFVPFSGSGSFTPGMNVSGKWVNNCGVARDSSLCSVALPAPVGRVDEVKVDGAVIPTTDYTVMGNLLVWVGAGTCPWPATQNVAIPDTEDGTMSVTYLNAYPVDSLGAYAVGLLAIEFAKACTGAGKCSLPKGVTSVVRQGVSYEINTGAFPDGVTGIREVDTYLALWNPGKLRQPTGVYSPDQPRFRHVTLGDFQ